MNELFEQANNLANQISCDPFVFKVISYGKEVLVQARLWRKDIDTNEMGWGMGTFYIIHSGMGDDAIIKTFFRAALDYAEHEVRESFQWKGKRILSPHVSLEDLWKVIQ